MSLRAYKWAWSVEGIQAHHAMVLLALADFANEQDEAWPSLPTLSEMCRVDVRSVRRRLRQLEEMGLIQTVVSHGRGRPSQYRLAIPDDENGVPSPSGSVPEQQVPPSDLADKTGHPCPGNDGKTGHGCPLLSDKTGHPCPVSHADPPDKTGHRCPPNGVKPDTGVTKTGHRCPPNRKEPLEEVVAVAERAGARDREDLEPPGSQQTAVGPPLATPQPPVSPAGAPSLFDEVCAIAGVGYDGRWPSGWMPPGAQMRVEAWRGLGLSDGEILAGVRAAMVGRAPGSIRTPQFFDWKHRETAAAKHAPPMTPAAALAPSTGKPPTSRAGRQLINAGNIAEEIARRKANGQF